MDKHFKIPVVALCIVWSAASCTKRIEQPPAPPPAPQAAATPPPAAAAPRPSSGFPPERTTRAAVDDTPDAAPAVRVRANTLNGDPNGLKREQLDDALQGMMAQLSACFQGTNGPPTVGLAFDADPSGKAANVKVTGADPAAERCVSSTMATMRLPAFQGPGVPVQFPLSIFRPTAPPAPPPAPVQAPPAAPPSTMPTTPAPVAGNPPPGSSTAPYVPPPAVPVPAPVENQVFVKP